MLSSFLVQRDAGNREGSDGEEMREQNQQLEEQPEELLLPRARGQ